jgi:hypothetical protein
VAHERAQARAGVLAEGPEGRRVPEIQVQPQLPTRHVLPPVTAMLRLVRSPNPDRAHPRYPNPPVRAKRSRSRFARDRVGPGMPKGLLASLKTARNAESGNLLLGQGIARPPQQMNR